MVRQKFTRNEIEQFRASAMEAPSVVKTCGLSLRDAVIELADVLMDMQTNRGYTTEDLVIWWHEQGVTVSAATLRTYLKKDQAGPVRPASRRSPRGKTVKTGNSGKTAVPLRRGSSSTNSAEPPAEFPGLKISEKL